MTEIEQRTQCQTLSGIQRLVTFGACRTVGYTGTRYALHGARLACNWRLIPLERGLISLSILVIALWTWKNAGLLVEFIIGSTWDTSSGTDTAGETRRGACHTEVVAWNSICDERRGADGKTWVRIKIIPIYACCAIVQCQATSLTWTHTLPAYPFYC